MSDSCYGYRNVIKLACDFKWEEAHDSVEGNSFMLILDHLEGEEL